MLLYAVGGELLDLVAIGVCRGRQCEQVPKGIRHSWTKSLEVDTQRTEKYALGIAVYPTSLVQQLWESEE